MTTDQPQDEHETALRQRLHEPIEKVSAFTLWVRALRPYRVYRHFSTRNGFVLAGGIAYRALFALFAAVYVGFAAAGIWLTGRPDLLNALYDLINSFIPNLIGEHGVISPASLSDLMIGGSAGLSIFGPTGILAIIGLLWTAIGWLYFSRLAVRTIFDLPRESTGYLRQRGRDLWLGLAFGFVLVFTALLTVLSTGFIHSVQSLLGLPEESFWSNLLTRLGGYLLVLVINTLTLGMMFRVLSKVYIPWSRLATGSVLGAAALGLLQVSGTLLFEGTRNPLLQSFVVIIGLLLWLDISSVIILLAAAWIAIGMADDAISAERVSLAELEQRHRLELAQARRVLAQEQLLSLAEELDSAGFFRRRSLRRRIRKAEAEFRAEFEVLSR